MSYRVFPYNHLATRKLHLRVRAERERPSRNRSLAVPDTKCSWLSSFLSSLKIDVHALGTGDRAADERFSVTCRL